MISAKLRKVGGSTILAIPPSLLGHLSLRPDAVVELSVEDGAILVRAARRRYRLAELLAGLDCDAERDAGDEAWLSSGPVGREEI